jgi:hypothetical protein
MLPDNPDNLKIINNILIYSLLGFRNNDIADLMSISPVQIDTIKQLKSYDRMVELVIDRVITNDSDSIRQAFHFTAKQAIEKLNTLLNSSNERVVLATAKDLLDRGGFRPAEMTESRNKLDNGLVIEYVSKDKAQAIEQATNGDK